MPNVIQAPELILRLARFFGLKQLSVTPSLEDNVLPVVVVGDLSAEPFPVGAMPVGGRAVIPAPGAGLFATFALLNPPGSKRLLKPQFWQVGQNAIEMGLGEGAATLGNILGAVTPQVANLLDLRFINRTTFVSPIVGLIGSGSDAVVATGFMQTITTGTQYNLGPFDLPLVLDEGDFLLFRNSTANVAMTVNLRWLEFPKFQQQLGQPGGV